MKSMTGFSSTLYDSEWGQLQLEIRSVNSRYLDCSVKLPRELNNLESSLKKTVAKHIARGRVYVSAQWQRTEDLDPTIVVDEELAQKYYTALSGLKDRFGLSGEISLDSLIQFRDILKKDEPKEVDPKAIALFVEQCLEKSIATFDQMRLEEGAHLSEDIVSRLRRIEQIMAQIQPLVPEILLAQQKKIKDKMESLLQDEVVDESRLLMEVAVLSDRSDVSEEMVRFKSHLDKVFLVLDEPIAIGRKVEFILQEMNREINTLSTKCSDFVVSELAVEVKCELEKVREQIQNVE